MLYISYDRSKDGSCHCCQLTLFMTASHIHTQARTDAYICARVCIYIYIYIVLFLEKILESDSDSKYIHSLPVMSSLQIRKFLWSGVAYYTRISKILVTLCSRQSGERRISNILSLRTQNACRFSIVLFLAIFLKNNSRPKIIVGKKETQN